jgi:hypothetical protein
MVGHSVTLTLTSHDNGGAGDPTYTLFDDVALTAAVQNPVVNPSFEGSGLDNKQGSLSGWTLSGTGGLGYPGHTGGWAGVAGWTTPTNGDSSLTQTFTMPNGATRLTFWYLVVCKDDVAFDWATATLTDNVSAVSATVLSHTCTNNGAWVQDIVSAPSMAGHSVTLSLINHDDNVSGDETYTFYDDVVVS